MRDPSSGRRAPAAPGRDVAAAPGCAGRRTAGWLRPLALVLVLGLAVTLLWVAGEQGWTSADVVTAVRRAGPWGAAGFVVAFACVQPLGISGHVFCIAAVALWPPWQALALAWAGAVGSAMVAMGVTRWLAFDAVQARLSPRLRSMQDRLVRGGWRAAFVVRLVAFTAHPVQVLFGVVPLPFGRVLSATVLAFLPTVALDVFFGGKLLAAVGWGGVS